MADKNYNSDENDEVLDLEGTNERNYDVFYNKFRKTDKKIKTSNSYNNNTVIYIISMVALFVIWFTAFAQPLAFNNRLLIFNNQKKEDKKPTDNLIWNVGFTDMRIVQKKGQANEVRPSSYTKTRATFHVSFVEPGDEITYRITIKNSGTIDAKVSDIVVNPITDSNDPILYTISDIEIGDELDAGKSTTMRVNIKYNPNYGGPFVRISKELNVFINYVQK